MSPAWLQTLAMVTRPVRHPVNTAVKIGWRLGRLPDQSWREMALLKTILASIGTGTVRVFEWGMGRSTLFYPRYLRDIGREFEWHAIDHTVQWYERVKRRVRAAQLESRVFLYCAEIDCDPHRPCVSALADPERVRQYVEYPKRLPSAFDVLFVDGRFRRRCLLQAREVVRPEGVVLLHDAQRPYYREALAVYPFSQVVYGGRFPDSRPPSQMWIGGAGDVTRWSAQDERGMRAPVWSPRRRGHGA